jgi:2-oxoisovalerate dehydrogenase E2 component (dihydrolipoyl transacylase)
MGIHVIKMPDLGEGIAEVEVVAWRVQPGDTVKEDQVLADVMTDKATVEIPSPVNGVVTSLGGKTRRGDGGRRGTDPPRGRRRRQFQGRHHGCARAGGRRSPDGAASAGTAEEFIPITVAQPETVVTAVTSAETAAPAKAAPPVPAPAPVHAAATAPAHHGRAVGEKPLAAPAVRQRAWDMGIELQYVTGSGPAGRITHADLDEHLCLARPADRPPKATAATPRWRASRRCR